MPHRLIFSPWMTRREAAEYLRWSVSELDGNLVPLENHPASVRGKMRYQVMVLAGDLRVRILAADGETLAPGFMVEISQFGRF